MARLSDVAARAGVSMSAVSRVLSNAPDARVSEETRARILDAARELSYRPNSAGRALRSSRSHVVALIVPDLMNAIFFDLVRGVEDAAISKGYLVLMGRTEDVGPDNERIDKLLGEGRVDAVLLQPGDQPLPASALGDVEKMMPVQLINSVPSDAPGAITMPDQEGARVAVRHLLDLGHSQIGLVAGLPESHTSKRRIEGFTAEMSSAGLPVDPASVTSYGYTAEDGERAAADLLDRPGRPSAYVVANVNAAIGFLAQARRMAVRIPEDASVIAIHDSWTAANTWPPLSAVKMPWYELGRRAFEEAHRRIEGGGPTTIVVDDPAPLLVARESTSRTR